MKSLIILLCLTFSSISFAKIEKFSAGRFGAVTIYGAEKDHPGRLVLFFSGNEGWDTKVSDMALALETPDTVVVGVNTHTYFKNLAKNKEKCHYSAADLESLSHLIQIKYAFKEYIIPTLIGYSSGATLVYAALAQAPSNTFRAALSIGFCPDIEIDKPFCKGSGLEFLSLNKSKKYQLKPYTKLKQPWIILSSTTNKACKMTDNKNFIENLPNVTLIEIPNTQKNELPQLTEAFNKIQDLDKPKVKDPQIEDLPVEELDVEKSSNNTLIIVLSGDGGWASLDKDLANAFNLQGYSVVGLNSLKYFWKTKKPDDIGRDLNRIANYYTKAWKKEKIIWVGYSMGADALPFGLTRVSEEVRKKSLAAVYIGLSKNAEFEFTFTNWLSTGTSEDGKPTKPEIQKLTGLKNLCFYGSEEEESGCEVLKDPVKVIELPGGHHFGGDYDKIASLIIKGL